MKLKKDQFKKILKECIMELVDEGAFNKVISESLQSAGSSRPASNDLVSNGENSNPYQFGVGQLSPNERLKEVAQLAAQRAAGNDPKGASILASVLEDTAKTTWQQTMAAEHGAPGANQVFIGEQVNQEQVKAEQAQLEALSGGRGASHWAALAFGRYNK